jgi:conjugal transfer ATP-binding protein TraC
MAPEEPSFGAGRGGKVSLSGFLFGKNGGMTVKELESMSRRSRFSDYLPWLAYDKETMVYLNTDNTLGFIWECSPMSFAGENAATTLEGLMRLGLPENSVIQFILHADSFIDPIIGQYSALKTRDNPVVKRAVGSYAGYLRQKASGRGCIPLRNFRLFVTIKVRHDSGVNIADTQAVVFEILKGAGLSPVSVEPEGLLDLMRRLFNGHAAPGNSLYDENVPIRKQAIFSETEINKHLSFLRIGENFFRCVTPKSFPGDVNVLLSNGLAGGYEGMVSDVDQFETPFIYALNIVFQNMKTKIHAKCNLVLQQQAAGSFAPSLKRKQSEYLWAVDEVEKGTRFVRIIPAVWVWGRSEEEATESVVKARRIWESRGFVMQEDKGILPVLFISALPFGLYAVGRNIDNLERDFIVPSDTASVLLPVQADFSGAGSPALLFTGRKGQICGLDVFGSFANNHNIYIAASTGSGKSFLVNYLVFNYYAMNYKVRIIDIGGSYKKMARMFGGRFLEFTGDSDICLNPFTNVTDIQAESAVISSIITQMVYSATDKVPHDSAETIMTLIKAAVKWAFGIEGNSACIDTVYRYLNEFPKHASDYDFDCPDKEHCAENFKVLAQTLAFNLSEFTSGHLYGKWFNGRATFDISQDEFVVLELEHLKPRKDLFKVVTLQVVNAVTQDLYLGDRSRPSFIIFDEAWQFLSREGTMNEVIQEGYRRARKYNGSFSIITQSILDLKAFGSVGEVINSNSAFKFFLESGDFEKAEAEKMISYDAFTMKMLRTLKSNRPKYSEIFMHTPAGVGVGRLMVDPYSYYIYTSDAKEISGIERLVKEGMSYEDAIAEMVRMRGNGKD